MLSRYDEMMADGYIFVFQDIRGRYGSEGKFVMLRPVHEASDAKGVDEATDTYDTIDWLVKNVKHNNGRVGMDGISYDGFLVTMGMINPHPALKAVSEQACMGDTFLGDDFFHNGAFRLSYAFEYTAAARTEHRELQLSLRSLRSLSVVSRPRPALQRQRQIFSRQDSHLERFHRPFEL